MAEKSLLRIVLPAVASGVLLASAFYVLGGVANPILTTITAVNMSIVGFAGGFAVGLSNAW